MNKTDEIIDKLIDWISEADKAIRNRDNTMMQKLNKILEEIERELERGN